MLYELWSGRMYENDLIAILEGADDVDFTALKVAFLAECGEPKMPYYNPYGSNDGAAWDAYNAAEREWKERMTAKGYNPKMFEEERFVDWLVKTQGFTRVKTRYVGYDEILVPTVYGDEGEE